MDRVAEEGLWGRHFFDSMTFPKSVVITKGFEARLLRDARPGQNNDVFSFKFHSN